MTSKHVIQSKTSDPLVDRFGRVHTSLRISVTDRCNIRCFYCMPDEHVQFLPRPDILTFEELERATKIFCQLGIRKLRITGGEPLVRKELPALIGRLTSIPQVQETALTTNGVLLEGLAAELKAAGLNRLNISLDSLDRQIYQQMTRRDCLDRVLSGIAAAKKVGFKNIRLNAVAISHLTETQIVPLTRFALENELHLRFIEFMPLNAQGRWETEDVLSGARVREILENEFGRLDPITREDPSQPAVDFRIQGSDLGVGFINSVTEPFCESCNRVRLTADGNVRNCLFSNREWDLRQLLRSEASDEQIKNAIRQCVLEKHAAHGIGSEGFAKPERAMYQIGG